MTSLLSRAHHAAGGLALDAALYGLSAVFALVTALSSTLLPHRAWGSIAAWGYLAAFVVVLVQLVLRRPVGRRALTWATFVAVCLVPLVVQAVQRAGGRSDRAQEEVLVVERMGARLASSGTPYLSHDAIAALPVDERLEAYSPYQPGMALFGLPRAWFGEAWWTDARIWFAIFTVAILAWAIRSPRALQAATVFPVCALTLTTGGDDLPVLALTLLALALLSTSSAHQYASPDTTPGAHDASPPPNAPQASTPDSPLAPPPGEPAITASSHLEHFGFSGLAIGLAAAMKLFALPVLVVLAVFAFTAGGARRFLPGALGLPLFALVPALLVDFDALVENVIRFPLGHGLVSSPAQSPFPGQLIASSVPGGRYVAAALLVAAGLAILVMLLRRPPRTAAAAGLFSGYGLLAAILLMPTTRFGYLLYPVALLVWAYTLSENTVSRTPRGDEALYRL